MLSSKETYAWERSRIRGALGLLLEMEAFEVAERTVLKRALDVYVAHPRLDFGDATTVAAMQIEGVTELYAYDRDFDRVPGITRREPGIASA